MKLEGRSGVRVSLFSKSMGNIMEGLYIRKRVTCVWLLRWPLYRMELNL